MRWLLALCVVIASLIPGLSSAQRQSDGEFSISVFFFIYEDAAVFQGESCALADAGIDSIKVVTSNQDWNVLALADFLAVPADADHSPVEGQGGCLLAANARLPRGSFAIFMLGDTFLGNFKKSDLYQDGYAYISVSSHGSEADDKLFLGEDKLFDSVETLYSLEVQRDRPRQSRTSTTQSRSPRPTPTATEMVYDDADPILPIPYLSNVVSATQMAYVNEGNVTASSPFALTIVVYEFTSSDESISAVPGACNDINAHYLGYGPSESLILKDAECGYGSENMIVTFLYRSGKYLITVTVGAGAFATEWVIALAGNQGVENLPSVVSGRGLGEPWKHWSGPTNITDYTHTPVPDRP